jgi:hypothetical protein
MADEIARLGIEINSKDIKTAISRLDKLEREAGRTEKATKKLSGSFRGLGGAIAAIGIGVLGKKIIDNTIRQEKAVAQLDAAIASTGMAAGLTSEELQDMAKAMQDVTTYGDEANMEMQAVLLTFTQVGKETFPRAANAILDVSTRMGTDLKSSALQVGKALNDPIRGLDGLSRAGIQFSDQQKEVIKSLASTGDMAGAQSLILKELETQFGGAAKAARQTFGGAIEALGNTFGDLLEEDGDGLKDATVAVESLTKLMGSPETKAAFGSMTSALIKLVELAAKGVVGFTDFGKAIGEFAGELAAGPLEKQATQAIVLLSKQEEAVKGLSAQLLVYRENLIALSKDPSATGEQIAAFEAMIVTQEKVLEREERRLLLMQGINQETKTAIALEVEKAAVAVSPVAQMEDPALAGFDDEVTFLEMRNEAEREAAEERLAIQQDYYDRLYNLETGSQQAIFDFTDAIRNRDLKGALKVGALALSNAAKQSKEAFEIQKALALANAVVTLPSAIIKSFEAGGGYPFGLIPAGLMAAQGAAQISAISSSSFGGGGSAPSVGGGGGGGVPPGATATPQGLEREDTRPMINFDLSNIDPDALIPIRTFAERLQELQDDGVGA